MFTIVSKARIRKSLYRETPIENDQVKKILYHKRRLLVLVGIGYLTL